MLSLFLLLLAVPRIDPAGVPGEILAVGDGLPESAFARFGARVGKDGRVLVLTAGKDGGVVARLKDRVKAEVRPFAAADDGSAPDLKDCAGVWIAGSDGPSLRKYLPGIEKQCLSLLQRGGVVAFSGAALPLAAREQVKPAEKGLALLPDTILGAAPSEALKAAIKRTGAAGIVVGKDSALLVAGRDVRAIAGSINLLLSPGNGREAFDAKVEDRGVADLTTLRRSARARAEPAFPPEKMANPFVETGTLVIIGGGGMPKGMVAKFVELAGGKEAKIVVLPTALAPAPIRDKFGEACKRLGAKVTLLRGSTLKEVESEKYIEAMKEATGIWFGGGRQWRFVDAYEGTKLLPLMRDVLKRGGVIGGSSAGATIQGDYLCRGGYFENTQIASEGYERGFAFLPGTAIDQHFAQRKRFKDMADLMNWHPQMLGIGLDEATAILVRKSRADVIGRGEAHFYAGKGKPVSLKDGAAYDMKERKEIAK